MFGWIMWATIIPHKPQAIPLKIPPHCPMPNFRASFHAPIMAIG